MNDFLLISASLMPLAEWKWNSCQGFSTYRITNTEKKKKSIGSYQAGKLFDLTKIRHEQNNVYSTVKRGA